MGSTAPAKYSTSMLFRKATTSAERHEEGIAAHRDGNRHRDEERANAIHVRADVTVSIAAPISFLGRGGSTRYATLLFDNLCSNVHNYVRLCRGVRMQH